MIREKVNNNHKNKDQSWYKNQINQILRDEIEKKIKTKYTTIKSLRTKFDIINK
jgi:hypothetical protein